MSGLDIFQVGKQFVSGWVPLYNREDESDTSISIPFTTHQEEILALYLAYHPLVHSFQRGDASDRFVRYHKLHCPLGSNYPIPYMYDGQLHDYLPDYVGFHNDGSIIIAEAGLHQDKLGSEAVAKAQAARLHACALVSGGMYWIGTDKTLPKRLYWNLVHLHSWRPPFPTFHSIAPYIEEAFSTGQGASVRQLTSRFESRWHKDEVEAAAWKVAGDAAAEGYLLFYLSRDILDNDVPLQLIDKANPPLLLDPLPDCLTDETVSVGTEYSEREAIGEHLDDGILEAHYFPGATINDEHLSEEMRDKFLKHRNAVLEVCEGGSLSSVAREHGITRQYLHYLVTQTQKKGEIALIPHRGYKRDDTTIRPEFRELIRVLYKKSQRLTARAVEEHPRMRALAQRLTAEQTEKQGRPAKVDPPSYKQICRYIKKLKADPAIQDARSGQRRPWPGRMATESYIHSIPGPMTVVQVDEHVIDQRITTRGGVEITKHIYCAALICVKTGAVAAIILRPHPLREADYLCLLKMAMEDKTELTSLYGCENRWGVRGKPSIILSDHGRIFTSRWATDVITKRFRIIEERAPTYCPTAKGCIEALWKWVCEKYTWRMPGTLKGGRSKLGAYDPSKDARKAGIPFDVLESYFVRAIVDDWMQDWDDARHNQRTILWEQAVYEKGVRQFLGSRDELTLLLMKRRNVKTESGGYTVHGDNHISFLNHKYVGGPFMRKLRGREVEIRYNPMDIRVLHVYDQGVCKGMVRAIDLNEATSEWQAIAERRATAGQAKDARAKARANREKIHEDAQAGRKAQRARSKQLEKEAREQEEARLRAREIGGLHTDEALAVLRAQEEVMRLRLEAESEEGKDAQPVPFTPAERDDTLVPLRRLKSRPIADAG